MNENRLMQQIGTIFGAFMTLFYLGVGIYLLLFPIITTAEKFLSYLVGGTFIFYGLYRAYRTYVKVKEVFFTRDEDEGK